MSNQDDVSEVSTEQYNEYLQVLEQFEDEFFIELAGTDRYQIVPMRDEDGDFLTKEAITAIKVECNKQLFVIIYQITKLNNEVVFYCPATKKTATIAEGLH